VLRAVVAGQCPPGLGQGLSRRRAVTLDYVLNLDAGILDAIVAHARRDHPDEACGVVAGLAGSDLGTRHIPMENAARSMTFYEFDSREYLRVWREMEDRDEEPVVIYHSHTATEAYPSRTDISFAGWPEAHYLLVSTRNPEVTEIRSFRIVDGTVTEEPVRLVNATIDDMAVQSYMFGQSPSPIDYECRA
jgi:[CysO sulfur-carrier protein]-S-L-cysteine hydrolase